MKPKVLVVDDDDAIRKLIKVSLEVEGFSVIEAASGDDTVDIVKNQKPNVVLLDIMMPGKDGYKVCKELKTLPLTKYTPVIFITVKGRVTERIEGLNLGADDYVTKPFNPMELTSRIEAVIHRSGFFLDRLTCVPTRAAFESELSEILAQKTPFHVVIVHLVNLRRTAQDLKPEDFVNLFQFLTDVITKSVSSQGGKSDFVGYLSRDTLAIITSLQHPKEFLEQLLFTFEKVKSLFMKKMGTQSHLSQEKVEELLKLKSGIARVPVKQPVKGEQVARELEEFVKKCQNADGAYLEGELA